MLPPLQTGQIIPCSSSKGGEGNVTFVQKSDSAHLEVSIFEKEKKITLGGKQAGRGAGAMIQGKALALLLIF